MRRTTGRIAVLALLLAAASLLTACQTAQNVQWVRRPQIPPEERGEWVRLESARYGPVADARREEAVKLLTEEQAVPLSEQRAEDFLGSPVGEVPAGANPYLLRGVAYGSDPVWVDVWRHVETGRIWVNQATYGRPGRRVTRAEPIVAYLEEAPSEVCASATVGRDEVLVGRGCAPMLGGRQQLAGPACSLKTWRANVAQF